MGTVTFQNGTIAATGGTGLQFLNADGTYIFSDQVTLNGADAGIDLLFDSDGTFSFANADITSPTGTAINIDGGSSDVTFSAGSSVVQNNNATTIQVDGGHDGSLAMSVGSTIDATNGNGIQFNDADGVYNMNSATTLAGGDAGIDIVGGSGGTFGFVGAQQITNSTGVAVNIDGGGGQAAQVTFTGLDIDQSVGSGVIANNSGSLTISFSAIDNASGDGINATNTDLTTIVTTIGLNGVNTRGIQFASDSGDQLTLNNTDVSMNGAAGSIGIRVENTSAVTALGLSGNGNTSLNATTATQSVDAGGGFTGTINVNGGADNLP